MTQAREDGKGLSMQPFRMSALELLSAYRTRVLSPVEAMASVIERVEAYEPHIHATWLYAPERALSMRRAHPRRAGRRESRSGRSTACR